MPNMAYFLCVYKKVRTFDSMSIKSRSFAPFIMLRI